MLVACNPPSVFLISTLSFYGHALVLYQLDRVYCLFHYSIQRPNNLKSINKYVDMVTCVLYTWLACLVICLLIIVSLSDNLSVCHHHWSTRVLITTFRGHWHCSSAEQSYSHEQMWGAPKMLVARLGKNNNVWSLPVKKKSTYINVIYIIVCLLEVFCILLGYKSRNYEHINYYNYSQLTSYSTNLPYLIKQALVTDWIR